MSTIDDSKSWRPPLSGKDHQTDEALRIAYNHLFFLRDKLNSIESSSSASLSIDEIKTSLESGGNSVLNVTNLPGTLIEVQPSVLFGTYADRKKHSPKANKYCLYVTTDKGDPGGVVYYSNGSNWVYLTGTFSYGAKFQVLFADKAYLADGLTSSDLGLYVAIIDKSNLTYYHNGTKLAYYSGSQPILHADITTLLPLLDIGNVSDDNLQISITDWDGVIYTWDSGLAKFTYTSGIYADTYATMVAFAAGLGANDLGLQFQITDWYNVLYTWNGAAFIYTSGGPYEILFADIAALAAGLAGGDAGFPIKITDRNNLIYTWSGTAFVYTSGGPYAIAYSAKAGLAATLTANDTNLTIRITDWNDQIYTWSGTAFVWTSGDIVEFTWAQYAAITFTANDVGLRIYLSTYNHFLTKTAGSWEWNVLQDDLMAGAGPVLFEVDPGLGWALYNGSTVYYMKSDGTRGSVTLPDLTSAPAYLKGGASSSGIDAASGTSGSESAHQHELPFTMHGDDHNEVHWAADNIFGSGGAMTESTRSTATAEAGADNYALSGAGSAHDHGPGTLELSRITRKAYFRQ